MKPRLILYISGLLIYGIFRSFQPAGTFDKIEIVSNDQFILNNKEFSIADVDDAIRDLRKSINPDDKYGHIVELKVNTHVTMGIVQDVKTALRKNELRTLFFRAKPWWRFWKG